MFVDVNNSNYISFKRCGIRPATFVALWFLFSLRSLDLEEDSVVLAGEHGSTILRVEDTQTVFLCKMIFFLFIYFF